jgi:hypothetical protein
MTTTQERYTVCDAFEASEDGDPIMLDRRNVAYLLAQHDCDDAFAFAELGPGPEWDAADVLRWLGY